MSLRFVLGRSGSGKTTFLMNEMKEKLLENPNGNPIIYIVPEQMTFQAEYKLVSSDNVRGTFRLQVFSFTRLAWRILQETGGISRLHINSTGLSMLLQKIISENKDSLKIFSKSAEKFGFVEHVEKILTEFKRYCISPNELYNYQEELENERTLVDKLHDLAIIYQKFEDLTYGKYLKSEDYLSLLTEQISKSAYLKDAEIYIDGFHSFTPQEYAVIDQLMKHCPQVTVALNTEQSYRNELPDELSLFRMTGSAYSTIYEMAELAKIEVQEDIILTKTVRFQHDSLRHLEENFELLPTKKFEAPAQVVLGVASNPRSEIEGVVRKIQSFVRDHNYRYKDIAILLRNGAQYHDLIDTVFKDFNIPYYIDQKRSMLNHPLVELIRSSLEVITGYFRYDPVFRAVKTDLLFPLNANINEYRERMDRLENYCIAYGIQGEKWTSKKRWIYRKYRGLEFTTPQTDQERELENELNESRLMISAPIMRLANRLKKAESGRELCEALFLYLEELEIPAKLEKLQIEAEEKGQLLKSREHEQVWNAVIDLLEQYVEILGEEKTSIKQFAETIEAGLESLNFSLTPPSIDQVLVLDLELSRATDIKIGFIIGLNDGVLPKKFQDDGVLSDEDRELLISNRLVVAPTNKDRLLDEEFIAYKAFTTPSEWLYISYPIANDEGKALLPSPYIKRIQEMYPEIQELQYHHNLEEYSLNEQLETILNPQTTISHLNYHLQNYKRNYPIQPIWWDTYNHLIESDYKGQVFRVLSSLYYENVASKLSDETVKELYGDTIQGSISRMEMFNSCAFSHYLTHGLKLREREVFRLEAPDIGDLFHGALKKIGETIQERNLNWAKLTRQQIIELVQDAVQYLSPRLQNEILLSSNRHQYLKRKLEKVILRATSILSEHAKSSGFSPVGLEVSFGPKGDLPPVRFKLKNGAEMELVGRIDRIDQAKNENGTFLRIVDYKSSKRDLNLAEVYYGISLQMLTYLDIIMKYSEQLVGTKSTPAGVLYFHIHNPIIKSKKLLTLDEIENEILKSFKMNGLVLNDPNIVRLMDTSLDSGDSKIISAGIKKDGSLSARSKIASEDEFKTLGQYIHKVFQDTGEKILEGNVDIAPYKMNDRTPCTYCPFKSICRFDTSLEENNYRNLVPMDRKDAIKLVKEAVTE